MSKDEEGPATVRNYAGGLPTKTMTFSVKLVVPQPAHSFQFSTPSSNFKIKNSTLTRSLTIAQKSDGAFQRKFPNLIESDGTQQLSHKQPFIHLVRDCADKRFLEKLKAAHGLVLKSEYLEETDLLVLLNHVAHTYSKCSDFIAARRVFDKMSQRNIFSWTVMIAGATENGFFHDGFKFFCDMVNLGILPDKFAYSSILQTCIGLDCVELGKIVHAQIVTCGVASHTFVGRVHKFYAGDQIHLQKDHIYANVEELSEKIKSIDCTPDLMHVLVVKPVAI
ncbi:hypothetical protein FEM48_Zijuj03G0114100 [Ziziphus jujuba var. spinosa]|uniref:Pentatricopeptide repeat-containing protein n=1 Tax=Ziziphus jujuba var. spinosa TaxID=714518 RepID=A0A978U8Z0_ZIZJJ|nr:hypothetical protein FEM48_ZijujUnG0062800 [Ziziphus jujuba var. spinosa]KAH7537638.1 hypothetical protein FEM48_Zijuj03G0114100 [Ziziphus jujuba var. spinosa]